MYKAYGYKDEKYEKDLFDIEISHMPLSVTERQMVDFTPLDEYRQKQNKVKLDEATKCGIVKQFKIWRESKGGNLNLALDDPMVPAHGVRTSWETFVKYAQEGYQRIFDEIQKRRNTVKQKSLSFLREAIHDFNVDARESCLVFLKENKCEKCTQEAYGAPLKGDSFENRDKSVVYLENLVQSYIKALNQHERRINRGSIGYARSVHNREPRPERLPREDYAGSTYPDRGYSRSNERGRLAPNPFASKDESFHYEGCEHPQSDRAYPLASSEARESRLYAPRSSRRSSAAVRSYPSREADPDDSSRSGHLDPQVLSDNYFALQRLSTQSFQHAAEKRENLSERLTRVEGSQHGLTDRLDSQNKLTQKHSADVDKLKRVVCALQKESAQSKAELVELRAIVGRLLTKDQRMTDQKKSKD
jgi:hypothetical protein